MYSPKEKYAVTPRPPISRPRSWRSSRTATHVPSAPLAFDSADHMVFPIGATKANLLECTSLGQAAHQYSQRRPDTRATKAVGAQPEPTQSLHRKRKISHSRRSLPLPGFAHTPSRTGASHNMESPLALAQVNAGPRAMLWWCSACAQTSAGARRRRVNYDE